MNEIKKTSVEEIRKEAAQYHEKELEGVKMQLIVFKLGREEYAIPIDQIKEVVLTPRIASVPHTPAHVIGIANIRGSIITIMDLVKKFNLGGEVNVVAQQAGSNFTLVLASTDFKVGILVEEVPNTLTVYSSQIGDASDILQFTSMKANCIDGIVTLDDRMIIVLDINPLIVSEDFSSIDQALK